MNHVHTAIVGLTILANGGIGIAGISKAGFVVKSAMEVGAPASWVPLLGALKVAGATGLLLGLLGVPVIGVTAAAGLVAFFIVAIGFHVRARVFYNIAFPGLFLALAVGSLAVLW